MSKLLPWHDTPMCRELDCGGPVVWDHDLGVSPMCGACGTAFRNPTPEERAQIARAEAAWDAVLRGEVHEDKACARCGGVLPIEQSRLCPPCVTADATERNLRLFPEVAR